VIYAISFNLCRKKEKIQTQIQMVLKKINNGAFVLAFMHSVLNTIMVYVLVLM